MKSKNAEYIKNVLVSVKNRYSKDRLFQLSIDKAILIIEGEIIRIKTYRKSSYIQQWKKKNTN